MTFTNKDFEKAYPRLRNYAFYLTKNNFDEAEDLLQDTFSRMLEKIDKFHDGEEKKHTIERWGAAMMHNLFIDNKRYVKRFTPPMSFDDMKGVPNIPDDFLETHNDVVIREKSREIKAMLKKEIKEQKYFSRNVTEQYLQIFIYRCFGLSYAEIADHMGSNLNTIKTRMFHMKANLSELVKLK